MSYHNQFFTFEYYDAFKWAMSMTEEYKIYCVRKVLNRLPPGNLTILCCIFGFFKKITDNQSVNKMTAVNLAIVFAPILFKSKEETLESLLADQTDSTLMMEVMIKNHDKIFKKHFETVKKEEPEEQMETKKQLKSQVRSMFPTFLPQLLKDDTETPKEAVPITSDVTEEKMSEKAMPITSNETQKVDNLEKSTRAENEEELIQLYSNSLPKQPTKQIIPEELWYFGSISRTDAEQLLIACKVNALLVRTSSMQGCYAVSTYDCSTPGKHYFIHYLVLFDEAKGGFKLEESPIDTNIYSSLTSLINESPVFAMYEPAGKFKKS